MVAKTSFRRKLYRVRLISVCEGACAFCEKDDEGNETAAPVCEPHRELGAQWALSCALALSLGVGERVTSISR